MTPQELQSVLSQFTGTSGYYTVLPDLHLTDGTKFLCDEAECHWLIVLVAMFQIDPKVKKEPFQVYTLSVVNEEGLLQCTDGNENILRRKRLPYTDFPLPTITIYFVDGVVLLPSEY